VSEIFSCSKRKLGSGAIGVDPLEVRVCWERTPHVI